VSPSPTHPPTTRADPPAPPTPIHERPLTELPSDAPTGTFARFVLVAGCILGVMVVAATIVFLLIYWKAQHR
jgi:hypothetical protein